MLRVAYPCAHLVKMSTITNMCSYALECQSIFRYTVAMGFIRTFDVIVPIGACGMCRGFFCDRQ